MKKFGILDKIITMFALMSFSLWLGGSVIRMVIGFDIFEPGTAQLKGYSEPLSRHLAQLYAVTAPYVDFAFVIVFLAAIYLLAKFHKQIKSKGWLFMSLALVLIAAIPNFFLMYYDYNLVIAAAREGIRFEDPAIQKYFIERFTKLNFLDPLITMSGFAIAAFFAFKPLDKKAIESPNED